MEGVIISHISTYKCKINNLDTFKEICKEEGHYFQEGVHKVEMFGCQSVDAVASFHLPGWKYAIVIDELGISTGVIPEGESQMVTIPTDKPGTYEYYCSIGKHRELGMKGTLVIK